MSIFNLHSGVIDDYADFVRSFFTVADDRARAFIEHELLEEERLWPEALLQVSPSYARADSVDELVTRGWLLQQTANIFRDESGGPFHSYPRPEATLICGDFNFEPEDALHARMLAPFDDGTPPLRDAWEVAHPGTPHPSTFKIYDKETPDEPELHCDFVYLNDALARRITSIVVNREEQAADHQPVIVTFS